MKSLAVALLAVALIVEERPIESGPRLLPGYGLRPGSLPCPRPTYIRPDAGHLDSLNAGLPGPIYREKETHREVYR